MWDYGPLGVELKNNVKRAWWREMVQQRDDIVGLDAGILMHPQVWVTSGHVESFSDPLVECATDQLRFRLDELPGTENLTETDKRDPNIVERLGLKCPDDGGPLEPAAPLQPDVQDVHGPGRGGRGGRLPAARDRAGHLRQLQERPAVDAQEAALRHRPDRQELPQRDLARQLRLPDARVRADGDAVLRPPDDAARDLRGVAAAPLGVVRGLRRRPPERLRFREHAPDELAHYAKKAIDIEYRFPFGWKELEGIHNRGDWDLGRHQKESGENLEYFDPVTETSFVPWIVETAGGPDRAAFTFLIDSYREEEVRGEKRVSLALHPQLAPYKVAVLPLLKKRPEIVELCHKLVADLRRDMMAVYDDTASIGKLYRRQDEIGTPWCVTVDVDSLEDGAVTVRDRDSMAQERVPVEGVKRLIVDRLAASLPGAG